MAKPPAWYLSLNGQELGPFSRAEVQRRLTRGELHPDDLARTDQAPTFIPVAALLDPATERQLAYLEQLSVQLPPHLSKAAASRLITAALEAEWQDDPITERQLTLLRTYRIPYAAGTTKGEAAKLINDWLNTHPQAKAQYQRYQAGCTYSWLGRLVIALLTLVGAYIGLVASTTALARSQPGALGWIIGTVLVGGALGFRKGRSVARRYGLLR